MGVAQSVFVFFKKIGQERKKNPLRFSFFFFLPFSLFSLFAVGGVWGGEAPPNKRERAREARHSLKGFVILKKACNSFLDVL